MLDLSPVLARLDSDQDAALQRLFALLRFPSISTDPAHSADCRNTAEWLARDLAKCGFAVRVQDTEGHPLVIGHALEARGPHVLFYGHYDVQPVDPLDLWDTDPFDPQIKSRPDGTRYITGRGTSDDKGQTMTFLEACRAYQAVHGNLPCKISIVLEGEEESGGDSLLRFLEANGPEMQADIALICDTNMWDPNTPAICTQLRGAIAEEVQIHAANRDLHSGYYGGAAANPIHVLTGVLAAMHDATGRVTLPGFYDGVPDLAEEQRTEWRNLGFDEAAFLGGVGLGIPAGEPGFSVLEQTWARPTAEVNGIWGGYTGAGFKTVIPAAAYAKVSFRLVGTQDPEAVVESFREHVRRNIPGDCRAEFVPRGGSGASVMPTDDPMFSKARAALSEEWDNEAAFIGAGGSIPVVGDFKKTLGLDSLLVGFALDDDRIHSPNEKYELKSFQKGCRSWARILDALAR